MAWKRKKCDFAPSEQEPINTIFKSWTVTNVWPLKHDQVKITFQAEGVCFLSKDWSKGKQMYKH